MIDPCGNCAYEEKQTCGYHKGGEPCKDKEKYESLLKVLAKYASIKEIILGDDIQAYFPCPKQRLVCKFRDGKIDLIKKILEEK